MKIIDAYLLATQAQQVVPDDDMNIGGDGYFKYKTADSFWMYPLAWWTSGNAHLSEQTSQGTVYHYVGDYATTTQYPNGWALMYFTGTISNWSDNPPRDGGGGQTNTQGAAAIYVFESRADALRCLKVGKRDKIVAGNGFSNCVFNYRSRSYGSGRTYSYFQSSTDQGITWHPALTGGVHELILSNAGASHWNSYDSNGSYVLAANVRR
ncbi:MAG: hypothetical protein IKQ32_07460 [Prevotella sp.]|nr:hypothetical protein [Prevotella sp.]